MGSQFGSWSLWLTKASRASLGTLDRSRNHVVRAERTLPAGAQALRFASRGMGKGAEVVLSAGGEELARGSPAHYFRRPAAAKRSTWPRPRGNRHHIHHSG
jgi:hypothetical protein